MMFTSIATRKCIPSILSKALQQLCALGRALPALCLLAACLAAPAALGEEKALFTDVHFLGGPGRDSIYEALALPNGNLLLVCNTQEGHGGRPQLSEMENLGWLVCLAPDGTIAWEKTYGELPGQSVVVRPALQPDGTLTLWGHHSVEQVMDAVYLLTLDLEGNILSRQEKELQWNDIHPLPTGGHYWVTDYSTEEYQLQTPQGEVLSRIPFQKTGRILNTPLFVEGGMLAAEDVHNGIINERYSVDDTECTIIKRLTMEGEVLWQTDIRVEGRMVRLRPMLEAANGDILCLGLSYTSRDTLEEDSHALTALLDNEGTLLWQKEVPLQAASSWRMNGFITGVEVEEGFALVSLTQDDTLLTVHLLSHQGQELGQGSFRAEKEVYSAPEMITCGDSHWLFDRVERRDTSSDTLVMRLQVDALRP